MTKEKRHVYMVSAITDPFGEIAGTTTEYTPEHAVLSWFRYSEKYPTCVAICPATKDDGFALLQWAEKNSSRIARLAEDHKCPYRSSWLIEQISSQVEKGECGMSWEYDQLFPFCMG